MSSPHRPAVRRALCSVTSLGCSWRQRLPLHHASSPATRQASSRPAARMQKTPAKLCSLRERPSGLAPAWLLRSQRPVRGHHFCFMMSRSPFSCSSRILGGGGEEQLSHRVGSGSRGAECRSRFRADHKNTSELESIKPQNIMFTQS